MKLGDFDALKEKLDELHWTVEDGFDKRVYLDDIIDSIPIVSTYNLEKHSYIEGYKAGCEKAKKCYERPQSFWVKEENESYYFDRQTGDLVVGVRYHCFKCNGSGDNKDKFCKHCGADMKGGKEEC